MGIEKAHRGVGRGGGGRREEKNPQPATTLVRLEKELQVSPGVLFLLPVLQGLVRGTGGTLDTSKHIGGLGGAVRAELPPEGLS